MNTLRFSYGAVLSLVLCLGHFAPTQAAGRPGTTATNSTLKNIRIDNFGRINENYFRGAQPHGRDYLDLATLGVNAILDLTSDDGDPQEERMARAAGLAFFKLPMTVHTAPTAADLKAFFEIVNDPENQPIYVHCVGGKHRTGVMTAIYRMAEDGWTSDQAFSEMKRYRFGLDFLHPEFKHFVYAYAPTDRVRTTIGSQVAINATRSPEVNSR